MNYKSDEFTPQQVVEQLDQYIIGQKDAKRSVAIAFRERWRRRHADELICQEILPNNILMKGPTGTGKTEIGRRLAKLCNIPFVKVEATMYTEKGYVGGDVNEMIVSLTKRSMDMVRHEREDKIKQEVTEKVDTILLDLLVPPLSSSSSTDDKSLNRGTRIKYLEKIKKGDLDDRMIEITLDEKPSAVMGNMLDDNQVMAFQDMVSRVLPKRKKKQRVSLATARRLLFEQEVDKRLEVDMDTMKKEAIERAENGIVFIDELDKICGSAVKGSGPDVSREGVQRNLLPIIEGCTVNTRIGPVRTDYILFIAAGAFHHSQPSDLMPELQGRFPIRVELGSLTNEHFYRILKEPKNSLIKQQEALFRSEGVEITFTEGAIKEIAKVAHTLNLEREDIGARRLRTVLMVLLDQFLFEVPDVIESGQSIRIDTKLVSKKLNRLMEEQESSKYIL